MSYMTQPQSPRTPSGIILIVLASMLALGFVFGGFIGCASGYKAWGRYQKRAEANNQVKVTEIQIRNQQQRVKIAKQKAEIRYVESTGIRRAQDEIAKTLTPLYIQHEAIQAQEAAVQSENHTMIWAPSGAQGVPLVSTVDLQKISDAGKK